MNNYTVTSKLLQGLGKPTRRGIKKCSKCGIYNGTRGTFCKNKKCGVSLKTENHAYEYGAVKLVTGTVRQVYSVRVKVMALGCRGFVQLPSEDNNNILSDVALCFVDSCQRSFDNSILMCHEEGQGNVESEICEHINLALKSQVVAKPVNFNKHALSRLKIPNEMKEKLGSLIGDSESPLVQRVSKNVMAVKCQVTPKQPLGYLHFTIVKGRQKGFEKYRCDCTEYLVSTTRDQCNNIKYKCLHYYACMAALSGDQNYSEEYSHFINEEISLKSFTDKSSINTNTKGTKQIDFLNIRNHLCVVSNQLVKSAVLPNKETSKSSIKKHKYNIKRCKRIVPKIFPIEIKVLNDTALTKNNEDGVCWYFLDWLAFVTESINKTMQFINCGIVNTQVFYVPESFWVSLRQRIPSLYAEQKSNLGAVFYQIMNVNHVKEVFDTPKVKIRIAKKFIHNEQKGYIEYDENDENNAQTYHFSFIFFLNVGQSTVDESDDQNNSFMIEWLPSLYDVGQIGQLKLQYKYGRKSI